MSDKKKKGKSRKTKVIFLAIVSTILIACGAPEKEVKQWSSVDSVNMRSDNNASYQRIHHGGISGTDMLLMYMLFRPNGYYYGGSYHSTGYHSRQLGSSANVGSVGPKAQSLRTASTRGVSKGGFGGKVSKMSGSYKGVST